MIDWSINFLLQVRATSPDGSPTDNIKVKVVVRAGYSNTLFNGDVTLKNGRGKIDVKEIPFDVKEVSFEVSSYLQSCPKL